MTTTEKNPHIKCTGIALYSCRKISKNISATNNAAVIVAGSQLLNIPDYHIHFMQWAW